MTSLKVRASFISYFKGKSHTHLPSSSLVPFSDPSLLFTNAGMVPLKEYFLGIKKIPFSPHRAVSIQKCMRAGGKHNDLDAVGMTERHHTFFEMLGNFSFGDYFKEEAIVYAWDYLTKELGLSMEDLFITVFREDKESIVLWKKLGVPENKIEPLNEEDNFWSMGETGPCGPCSEIHFDWKNRAFPSTLPKGHSPGTDKSGRFVEIWNLVFMQFQDIFDSKTQTIQRLPLPKPSVDTGAGLERLSSVMEGVYSNYDTSLFHPILTHLRKIASLDPSASLPPQTTMAMKAIADHLRASVFLISDGVLPDSIGRGYVLRRILRRAIRLGRNLNRKEPFLYSMVSTVTSLYGSVYRELEEQKTRIEETIRLEEEKFHQTLERGLHYLNQSIQRALQNNAQELLSDDVFLLYDTYGFPLDLIQMVAKESHLTINEKQFEADLEEQKKRSSQKTMFQEKGEKEFLQQKIPSLPFQASQFLGYQTLEATTSNYIILEDTSSNPPTIYFTSDVTPMYPEGGGQVGDKGEIFQNNRLLGHIETTMKIGEIIFHKILLLPSHAIQPNLPLFIRVHKELRKKTAINHTATHLLHAALRHILGDHVMQKGSLVEPHRLRFDFSHKDPLSWQQKNDIEAWIMERVFCQEPVTHKEMTFQEAVDSGALHFFNDAYGESVRVVTIGETKTPSSRELCGGTHLENTQEIGLFIILYEKSVASGVRRIEAITQKEAYDYIKENDRTIERLKEILKVTRKDIIPKVETFLDSKKETSQTKSQRTHELVQKILDNVDTSSEVIKIFAFVPNETNQNLSINIQTFRALSDEIKNHFKKNVFLFLGAEINNKINFIMSITMDLISKYNLTSFLPLIKKHNGTGGGREDFIQGSLQDTKDFHLLTDALKKLE